MRPLAILLILFCGSKVVSAAITENELIRRTQELYDAVVPGNQAPWKQYFAADCIFSDEKGRTMDKTKLIADITPLPTGYSGTIKLDRVESRIYDNVAILSYDANETETIFGQTSARVTTLPTPGCGATVIGKLSRARRIVTTKIRPWARLIQRSSATSSVATN